MDVRRASASEVERAASSASLFLYEQGVEPPAAPPLSQPPAPPPGPRSGKPPGANPPLGPPSPKPPNSPGPEAGKPRLPPLPQKPSVDAGVVHNGTPERYLQASFWKNLMQPVSEHRVEEVYPFGARDILRKLACVKDALAAGIKREALAKYALTFSRLGRDLSGDYILSVSYTHHVCGRDFADGGLQPASKCIRRLLLEFLGPCAEVDGVAMYAALMLNVMSALGLPCDTMRRVVKEKKLVRREVGKSLASVRGEPPHRSEGELLEHGKFAVQATLFGISWRKLVGEGKKNPPLLARLRGEVQTLLETLALIIAEWKLIVQAARQEAESKKKAKKGGHEHPGEDPLLIGFGSHPWLAELLANESAGAEVSPYAALSYMIGNLEGWVMRAVVNFLREQGRITIAYIHDAVIVRGAFGDPWLRAVEAEALRVTGLEVQFHEEPMAVTEEDREVLRRVERSVRLWPKVPANEPLCAELVLDAIDAAGSMIELWSSGGGHETYTVYDPSDGLRHYTDDTKAYYVWMHRANLNLPQKFMAGMADVILSVAKSTGRFIQRASLSQVSLATSRGYLFFQDGIYNFRTRQFTKGFDSAIVSVVNVPAPHEKSSAEENHGVLPIDFVYPCQQAQIQP